MGTEVQSKMYLHRPGHYAIRDLDENTANRSWNLHQETRASMYGQYYDKFWTGPSKEGYSIYDKQQMKQTILNQELVFKNQIHELHRLYGRQRNLMKDFQCQNKHTITAKDGQSRCKNLQKKLFDLDIPADQYIDIKDEQEEQIKIGVSKMETGPLIIDHAVTHSSDRNVSSGYNFRTSSSHAHFWNHGVANLNEPIKPHEPYQLPPFDCSMVELQKRKTIFGVEISERQLVLPPTTFPFHTPGTQLFGSSLEFSSEMLENNSSQNLGSSLNKSPIKHVGGLPWLKRPICSAETSKEKEGSQLFPIKTEIQDSSSTTCSISVENILRAPIFNTPPKSKLSHLSSIDDDNTKRTGSHATELALDPALLVSKGQPEAENQVTDKDKELNNNCISGTRHHFDLNMCLNEDEDVQSLQDDLRPSHDENVKFAAETIVELSSYCTPYSQPPPNNSLHWFADMISSHTSNLGKKYDIAPSEKAITKIDYFELMTLKLTETKTECYYKPEVLENRRNEETFPKRSRRGQAKRGRQKKDFQKDILPDIASLSRHEVTEDLQTIESMIRTTGGTWESSLTKRNAARGKRRCRSSAVVPNTVSSKCAPSIDQANSNGSSFTGWGKRTRRPPRQRYQIGNPPVLVK